MNHLKPLTNKLKDIIVSTDNGRSSIMVTGITLGATESYLGGRLNKEYLGVKGFCTVEATAIYYACSVFLNRKNE